MDNIIQHMKNHRSKLVVALLVFYVLNYIIYLLQDHFIGTAGGLSFIHYIQFLSIGIPILVAVAIYFIYYRVKYKITPVSNWAYICYY